MGPKLKLAERRIGKDVKVFTRQVRAHIANPGVRQAILTIREMDGSGLTLVLNPEENMQVMIGMLEWAKLDVWENYMKRRRARGEE